jgi:ribonuclease VapC
VIIDSSAVVAIVTKEPSGEACRNSLRAASIRRMSAANVLETSIVLSRVHDDTFSTEFDELLAVMNVIIEPVTSEQVVIAREAHRRYGRGSRHRARLNFGDCFAYALAKVYAEPLLFVGNDFIHTDLKPALSNA